MEFISKSIKETENFAKDFLAKIKPSKDKAVVLALRGDLGSGKTTFTQFLAKELGITNYVTSPTFVIEKKYLCADGKVFEQLIHIDCYRLNSPEEMLRLDWEEIINNPENLIVVEWPERIETILPKESIKIEFEFVGENERRISTKSNS